MFNYHVPLNLQLFAEGDDGLQSEKTFTQEDVERIVGERLGREGIKDMKEIVETLKEFGYEGSPSEIKAAVKAQAEEFKRQTEEYRKQAELEALKDEAKETGTTPELLKRIETLEKKLSEAEQEKEDKKRQVETEKQQQEAWDTQVSEFAEKYPDIDIDKLDKNEKFLKFVKRSNPNLTLVEVYEDFVEMVGGAEAEAIAKIQSNIDRSTSSGRAKGDASGGTHGLTSRQQQLAEENGMTFKEYADMLSLVKR